MDELLQVFKALSDETRLRIMNLLYERELCVCDVMETLKITQAKASRHLTYLKNAGLVKDRKHAQWVYYSITRDHRMVFVDHLFFNGLQDHEQFRQDLEELKEWLDKKWGECHDAK